MVFQNYALFPHMSVFENIAYGLKIHRVGGGDLRRRAEEAMQLVGLGGLGDRSPAQLSGGQQQRAAIARALATDPPIVVADEPTGNLDSRTAETVFSLISHLVEAGKTVIMVTHEVNSIRRMADRVVFLEKGHAVFSGTLDEALTSPLPSLKEFFARHAAGR